MKNINDGDILDTIITVVENNSPDGLCHNCPIVQLMRDIAEQVNEHNHQKIAKELGIDFSPRRCPCFEKFNNQKQ